MTTSRQLWIATVIGFALTVPHAARAAGVVTVCNEVSLKAALFGGGTVTFTCSGTITVLGGTIVISQKTTIDGTGHSITISGGGKVRVFEVNSTVLNLTNITVADGLANNSNGGGLLNNGGFVSVTNSSFTGNRATAVILSSGNGGGIFSVNGGLEIINSSFRNNFARFGAGGGIYMSGGSLSGGSPVSMIIDGSEFDGNGADSGSGIYNNAEMLIVNSTFFNSGTNIFNAGGGSAFLKHTTLGGSDGQGGYNLINQESLTLMNTILSAPPGGINCSGSVTDGGGNLRWPTTDPSCVGSYGNPKLGPLQNNGGPTMTMALMPGSVAIDSAVDALCLPLDQRGVLRPQGPHCDIGAYEVYTARSLGIAVNGRLNDFQPGLISLDAMRRLSDRVIAPMEKSLDPNLWPPCPAAPAGDCVNPQNGSEVFTDQRDVVNTLSQILVDPVQLTYINNLVLADRTLAVVALQDKGCGPDSKFQRVCGQAASEVAAGDSSAADGNFSDAITHYLNSWLLTRQ